MILCDKTQVYNFENAIRGCRNPHNSWNKSDSYIDICGKFVLGKNDLQLAKRLCKLGTDHRKFLRQIFISVDITAPLYWWKEFDTYKIGTVSNSTSTMHAIHTKTITINDFSTDKMNVSAKNFLPRLIEILDIFRQSYVLGGDKEYWYSLIQLLPCSYNQLRTITMNYENAFAMYRSRRNHKLDEWKDFCKWLETLPYFLALFPKSTEIDNYKEKVPPPPFTIPPVPKEGENDNESSPSQEQSTALVDFTLES